MSETRKRRRAMGQRVDLEGDNPYRSIFYVPDHGKGERFYLLTSGAPHPFETLEAAMHHRDTGTSSTDLLR